MTNKFEEMMGSMIEAMMTQYMEKAMRSFMANMLPDESNAEATTPEKTKKPSMTREEFLGLTDEDDKPLKSLEELDFEPVNAVTIRYNGYVPRDIWIINHMHICQEYGARYSKKAGGYRFNSHAEAVNFLQSYQIKTVLDATDRHNIECYKKEQAAKKAEYYANKAK